MAGTIADLLFQMTGQADPQQQLVQAIAGGAGTPAAPGPVDATPGGAGTGGATAAPPQPQAYTSPPELVQLYSDLLKRQSLDNSFDRGLGLIGASLAHPENRNSILAAFSGDNGPQDSAGNMVNNLLSLRANQTAATTKAAQRAAVPAIAKSIGLDDQTALYLFDTGKLDQVVAEAKKPDKQIVTDPSSGQFHIVDKNSGEISAPLGAPKEREVEIITGKDGKQIAVDKVTKQPIGQQPAGLDPGVRKTEYVDNPTTGGKDLVYSDTKEPVGANNIPGAGNTELQKNYNAAMRGLTPSDPGYMTLQEFSDAQKSSKGGFLSVGNGKVFDTSTGKFLMDPNDPATGVGDTDPNNAPVLAPGEVDKDYLSKLPPETQGLIKGLTDYTLDATKISSVRGDARQKLVAAAKRYDPSFDMTQFAARQKMRSSVAGGPIGQNLQALNTVIGHIGDLTDKGEKLSNTSYPLWNTVKNAWGSNVMGDPGPTNFEESRQAVASEMAKVFRGAGSMSEKEIGDWKDTLSSAQSPAQMKGAIQTALHLLSSRLDAVKSQYNTTMNKPWNTPFLNPKSQAVLKKLGVDPTEMDPTVQADDGTGNNSSDPELDNLLKKYGPKK